MAGKNMRQGWPTERMAKRRYRRIPALLIACVVAAGQGQPPKPSEYDVKAAYLLNFGKFIRHANAQPAHSSFDICLVGHDPISQTIDELAANETIDREPVHVRRVADVSEARNCAIAYLSASEGEHMREDLAILGGSEVLTVSDAPEFLERGGMIQFVLIANHVRFAINLNAVNHSHLVLSSELLRVASSVTGKPASGEKP